MFRASRIALAVAVSAALTLVVPVGPAAATTHTTAEFSSRSGDIVGLGEDYSYTSPPDNILAMGTSLQVDVSINAANGEHWSGRLTPPWGSTLQAGTTYSSARSSNETQGGLDFVGPGNSCQEMFGEFSIHEFAVDEEGALTKLSLTFAQRCGSPTAPLLRGAVAWNADAPTPPLPQRTHVWVTTNQSEYTYGAAAQVTVTLDSGSPNRNVSIYTSVSDKPKQLAKTVAVDETGKATVGIRVTERTTFTVVHDGDENFDSSWGSAIVKVKARVTGKMTRTTNKSGKYFLYPVTRLATYLVTVAPNHAGDCIRFRIEIKVHGRWQSAGQFKCGKLRSDSKFHFGVGTEPDYIGYPFRLRANWVPDGRNAASSSTWRYFKFTR